MRESTGEMNITLVVVLAVGLFMALFYYLIWPTIDDNMTMNTSCQAAWCEDCESGDCVSVTCHYKGKDFQCAWKG